MISTGTVVLLMAVGVVAGGLGAAIGIGGGIVVVPALVLGFQYDIRVAVAASLVAVVATSTSAGSAYVGEGLANMRLGMSLEVATTIGGIVGGLVAVALPADVVAVAFAVVMVATAALVLRQGDPHGAGTDATDAGGGPEGGAPAAGWEDRATLGGAYLDERSGRLVRYRARRLGAGSAVAAVAGVLSGLLGVGGGFLKVPAMTLAMGVPMRVAAATSNFMIGVTAISSLVVYFARGYVHPLVAVPVALGVVAGSGAGARLAGRVDPRTLTRLLAVVLVAVATQMALDAAGVGL
ncbi:MAG: TSUP family transporter [Acidimicrobiia bacterium]